MCECHPFGVQASPPLLDSPSRRVPPRRLRLISLEDMTDGMSDGGGSPSGVDSDDEGASRHSGGKIDLRPMR
jgi:hypothetical protein